MVDFQIHVDTARRPIDTYDMWGAATHIMGGLVSSDGFWYFQPWLIGRGRRWWQHAAHNADNLADLPAVQALAGRHLDVRPDADWPHWEDLANVAANAVDRVIVPVGHVHDHATGEQDSIDDALDQRGQRRPSDPHPTATPWNTDSLAELAKRLPRLSRLFPRQRHITP